MIPAISRFYNTNKRIFNFVFLILLCAFPFLKVAVGLDVTDTGYSLGNYEAFLHDTGTWKAATFLASATGFFFTKLPFGQTMLGMKCYTTMIPIASMLAAYLLLRKKIPAFLLFVGELAALGLCWCPVTILYNYLTYLLFTLGALFLYKGLTDEKRFFIVLAGIMLGMNIFVRFPNLAQMALILVVWYYCILQNKKKSSDTGKHVTLVNKERQQTVMSTGKQVEPDSTDKSEAVMKSGSTSSPWVLALKLTGFALAGYLIGIAVMLLIISVNYGFSEYLQMIPRLFAIGDDNASYTPLGMILSMLEGYRGSLKWTALLAIPAVVFMFFYTKISDLKFRVVLIAVESVIYLGMLYLYHHTLVFYHDYNDYQAIYFWTVFFLIMAILVSLTVMMGRRNTPEKLLALTNLVIIGITPLGSNNGLYPIFNNLFLVAPITLYLLWVTFGSRVWKYLSAAKTEPDKKTLRLVPLTTALTILIAAMLFQSILFGCVFTFRDTGFLTGKTTETVENNDRLAGMHTNSENAAELQAISDFITVYREQAGVNVPSDRSIAGDDTVGSREPKQLTAVFYGDIPALSYYLDIPGAISHTWANLPSYSYTDMETEMAGVRDAMIILNGDWYPDMDAVEEAAKTDPKMKLIAEYILSQDYEQIYSGDGYSVFYQ